MPGFNQTGPMGKGPLTGRGRGRCVANRPELGAEIPETAVMGRGMGYGYGFGRGAAGGWRGYRFGRMTSPQTDAEDVRVEIDRLQQQAASMQRSLEEIHQRIMEMEKSE